VGDLRENGMYSKQLTSRGLNPWTRFMQWLDTRPEAFTAYLYLFPSLLILLFTIVLPMFYAMFLSLVKVAYVEGLMKYTFVGLDNYLRLFQDDRFVGIIKNTMTFTVAKVVVTLCIGFGVSLTMYFGVWGSGVVKKLFLLPWALSNVVNSLMWQWMYSGNYGIINEIMVRLGVIDDYKLWLTDLNTAMGAVLVADIWKSVPYVALLLLASMQSISKELREACKVDGGGSIITFFHVILPHIRPVLMVLLVIETMWTLRTFDLIWILTKGGPQDSTTTLNIFAYEQAFQVFDLGYGSAISYIITLLTLIFTIIYMKSLKNGH
jgi:ABC-type sugar transport system permease subunit